MSLVNLYTVMWFGCFCKQDHNRSTRALWLNVHHLVAPSSENRNRTLNARSLAGPAHRVERSQGVSHGHIHRRFFPSWEEKEGVGRSLYEHLRSAEMDFLLLNPAPRRRDKDALSNRIYNYGLKHGTS